MVKVSFSIPRLKRHLHYLKSSAHANCWLLLLNSTEFAGEQTHIAIDFILLVTFIRVVPIVGIIKFSSIVHSVIGSISLAIVWVFTAIFKAYSQ